MLRTHATTTLSRNTSQMQQLRDINPELCTDPYDICLLQEIIATEQRKNTDLIVLKKGIYKVYNTVVTITENFILDKIVFINPDQVSHRQARALFRMIEANLNTLGYEQHKMYLFYDNIYDRSINERFYLIFDRPFAPQLYHLNPLALNRDFDTEVLNQLIDTYIINDEENKQKSLSSRCVYTVVIKSKVYHVRLLLNLAAYQSTKHPGERYAVAHHPLSRGNFATVEYSNRVLIRDNKLFRLHLKKPTRGLVLKRNCGDHEMGDKIVTSFQITQNEAALAARMSQPKIQGIAGDVANNEVVLFQRYVPGDSLYDFINLGLAKNHANKFIAKNCLSVFLRAKLSRLLFEALKEMHSKNIVHRDIKDEHIKIEFVFRSGINRLSDVKSIDDIVDIKKVTIIDYGLAKDANRSDIGECVGSLKFCSIESFQGTGSDKTTDNDAGARCLAYIWGSYHLDNQDLNPGPNGLSFFAKPQTRIPGLFEDVPMPDTLLNPLHKEAINNLIVKYNHPDKSQRPATEDDAIALFTDIENRYKPQATVSILKP